MEPIGKKMAMQHMVIFLISWFRDVQRWNIYSKLRFNMKESNYIYSQVCLEIFEVMVINYLWVFNINICKKDGAN